MAIRTLGHTMMPVMLFCATALIGYEYARAQSATLTIIIIASALCLVGCFALLKSTNELMNLRRRDADLNAFLQLTTHQLGMPLATFKWWLEILREKDDGAVCSKDDHACDQLQEGISRLDQIIDSLRDVTSPDRSRMNDHVMHASLPYILADVRTLTSVQLKNHVQTLVCDLPGDLPTLHIDGKLLAGVLRELIENASFYSPHDTEILLRARLHYSNVQIDVIDHGHGIPPEEISMIFGKHKRGSNAEQYKPGGNGVGLSIAKEIVDRAGGSMWITSELGKGTTVSLTLKTS